MEYVIWNMYYGICNMEHGAVHYLILHMEPFYRTRENITHGAVHY